MYVVVKNFIIELSETGWRQHKLLIHVDPLILKKNVQICANPTLSRRQCLCGHISYIFIERLDYICLCFTAEAFPISY